MAEGAFQEDELLSDFASIGKVFKRSASWARARKHVLPIYKEENGGFYAFRSELREYVKSLKRAR